MHGTIELMSIEKARNVGPRYIYIFIMPLNKRYLVFFVLKGFHA